MSTDSNSTPTASTATAATTKTSVPVAPVVPAKNASTTPVQPKEELVEGPKYKSEDYNGAPIVKLRLKQADTMQYDPQNHLKLDSTEPTEMPLTPFFAERIGRTIELCA